MIYIILFMFFDHKSAFNAFFSAISFARKRLAFWEIQDEEIDTISDKPRHGAEYSREPEVGLL